MSCLGKSAKGMDSNISIIIDGAELKAVRGETILSVARRNGIAIRSLCQHPDLCEGGSSERVGE